MDAIDPFAQVLHDPCLPKEFTFAYQGLGPMTSSSDISIFTLGVVNSVLTFREEGFTLLPCTIFLIRHSRKLLVVTEHRGD